MLPETTGIVENEDAIQELFWTTGNLASNSGLFDLQGTVWIKAVGPRCPLPPDYHQYFCRLRGNLLSVVPVESDHQPSSSSSLVVLESFMINLCQESAESENFEFCITLNPGKGKSTIQQRYYLRYKTLDDRDRWIERISMSSFTFLRSLRLAQLRQIEDFRIKNPEIDFPITPFATVNRPRFFLSCDIIETLCNTSNQAPLYQIKCYFRKPFDRLPWKLFATTEVVQSSRCAEFATAIVMPYAFSIFQYKFELFLIFEPILPIEVLYGFGYFQFSDQHPWTYSNNFNFSLPLRDTQTGKIAVAALRAKVIVVGVKPQHSKRLSLSAPNHLRESLRRWSSMEQLGSNVEADNDDQPELFNAPLCRQFQFSTYGPGTEFFLEERMRDSKLVFLIPQTLLLAYQEDQQNLKNFLELEFGSTSFAQDCPTYRQAIDFHRRDIEDIDEAIRQITDFMVQNTFRSSRLKTERFLQFVPINFHKQTCHISPPDQNAKKVQTFYTVGAYTCHHLGFDRDRMIAGNTNHPEVFETWILLKTMLKVCHNEKRINHCIQEAVDLLNQGLASNETERLKNLYQSAETLADELINVIPIEKNEKYLEDFSKIDQVSGYLDENQLEPIDLIYLNIKACFVDIDDKIGRGLAAAKEFDSGNRKLLNALKSLKRNVSICYLGQFAKLKQKEIDFFHLIQYRHLSLVIQALTTLIIFIEDNLKNEEFLSNAIRTRNVVFLHQVLLSCYAEEMGMIKDMVYALETVARTTEIVFEFNPNNETRYSSSVTLPDIDFNADKIRLVFPVSMSRLSIRPMKVSCKLLSLMFNIGINHQASLNFSLRKSLQDQLNEASFHRLRSYVGRSFPNQNHVIWQLVEELEQQIISGRAKNIRVLELAGQIVAGQLKTPFFVCCKSAKDRTGMLVTLEEVRFAFNVMELDQDLHRHLFQTMLDTLRQNGTRIENVYKNIGTRKYAFNQVQVLTFPALLRPPSGTIYLYSPGET